MESNSQLSVTLVTPLTHHDDIVCDAARVSFSRRASEFTDLQNKRLRRYLFDPKDSPVPHWAPFAMPRICLANLGWDREEQYYFLANSNLSGFSWEAGNLQRLNGSLWAWYENLPYFPWDVAEAIRNTLAGLYPDCAEVFGWEDYLRVTRHNHDLVRDRADVVLTHSDQPDLTYESIRIKAPIFVARQLVKHQRHMVWSEESRRYIDSVPDLYIPDKFHKRPDKSIKQGASSEEFDDDDLLRDTISHAESAVDLYQYLIKGGMAPEEARMFLPLNTQTEWIWTGSLRAFARVVRERTAPTAQGATRDLAQMINHVLTCKHGKDWGWP